MSALGLLRANGLVGVGSERGQYCQAQRLAGHEVNDQFNIGRRLHR